MENFQGYQPAFIGEKLSVHFPDFNEDQKADLAKSTDVKDGELKYIHYSSFLSKKRKFPYFTASNINGSLFKQVNRTAVFPSGKDEWQLDTKLSAYQWGKELYDARAHDFDKGHLTKREDTQWGSTASIATNAARDTFHYSNCTPQILELNERKWSNLEEYILKKEAINYKMLINVFTGPVLSGADPVFTTKVKGQDVQLPVLFWKVVYYSNDGKTLNKVGFLMGQEKLLIERKIAKSQRIVKIFELFTPEKDHFMDFEDAQTYQVNMSTIEKLSGLTFAKANEPFKSTKPEKLIIKDVQVTEKTEEVLIKETFTTPPLKFIYENIVL